MLKSALIISALASSFVFAPAAIAAPTGADSTAFVTTIIDKFNAGDTKAWLAAQEDSTYIVDDFGQHVWTGHASPQRWLDDYMKMSKAEGITGGRVDYGKPIATDSGADTTYLVLPTTYRFVQKGAKMASTGSMTFVVRHDGKDMKIASWTYSGSTAAPDK
jgi:hypothetical protein